MKDLLYRSGDFFFPQGLVNFLRTPLVGSDRKTFYVSVWSIVHYLMGIIVGYLLQKHYGTQDYYTRMFIIHTIWEMWQMLIGMSHPFKLTGRSNIVDTIIDTIFFMIGAYVSKKN